MHETCHILCEEEDIHKALEVSHYKFQWSSCVGGVVAFLAERRSPPPPPLSLAAPLLKRRTYLDALRGRYQAGDGREALVEAPQTLTCVVVVGVGVAAIRAGAAEKGTTHPQASSTADQRHSYALSTHGGASKLQLEMDR